jgi:hypothetical protein
MSAFILMSLAWCCRKKAGDYPANSNIFQLSATLRVEETRYFSWWA